MRKYGKLAIIPELGEVMDHKEVFGRDLCAAGGKNMNFGGRPDRDPNIRNQVEICIKAFTGGVTETNIRITCFSIMGNMMGGPRELIVADHPYADHDDEGVYAVMGYGYKMANSHLDFFVSADGKDPHTGRKVAVRNPDGGWDTVSGSKYPLNALPPRSDIFITLRRIDGDINYRMNPPLALRTSGSDNREFGGEVPIPQDLQNIVITDAAVPMTFGGVDGHFVPNPTDD